MPASAEQLQLLADVTRSYNDCVAAYEAAQAELQLAESRANDARAEYEQADREVAMCVQKQDEIRNQIAQLQNEMTYASVNEAQLRNIASTRGAMSDGAAASIPLVKERVLMALAQVEQSQAAVARVQSEVDAANES